MAGIPRPLPGVSTGFWPWNLIPRFVSSSSSTWWWQCVEWCCHWSGSCTLWKWGAVRLACCCLQHVDQMVAVFLWRFVSCGSESLLEVVFPITGGGCRWWVSLAVLRRLLDLTISPSKSYAFPGGALADCILTKVAWQQVLESFCVYYVFVFGLFLLITAISLRYLCLFFVSIGLVSWWYLV